ncbi:hypothetical protein Nepgr_016582 [Nepenthes gracilis]|uniref:Vacuolar amino acid transporter YPQ1 n=1 Tax=Nepenthes gracilis TaxID=150966 RepID=A0AAD3SQL0_NEPGR|nr:hypothetical protein Nepgr_016582 [Nepenthes gracilis]
MKPLLKRSVKTASYCWKEKKPCVGWVEKYFRDCLCDLTDHLSFGFGLISLLAWGVAEVPQIITNFRTKSSHGVSLLFLLTWVIGDIFNLVGCLLEPATLPTQFYTALLYTTSTIVLVLQSLYYDQFYRWWKCRRKHSRVDQQVEEERKPLKPKQAGSGISIPSAPVRSPARREFYYTSARSLASSDTPSFQSFLRVARSGPSAVGLDDQSSSDDESLTLVFINKPASRPIYISRSATQGAVMAVSVNLPTHSMALTQACIGFTGRRLLQENHFEHNVIGEWLGWLMAAIYMGGRVPQIILNIRRGSVEGLNPLMFIFALIANITYVASILVRSIEWYRIKANMPWLLDAIVCVALDLFIIMQYVYYEYLRRNDSSDGDYYAEADKAVVS